MQYQSELSHAKVVGKTPQLLYNYSLGKTLAPGLSFMYMFIVYSLSCKTRLLESKGNSLQKLLSPLMPVSLLLQLSDLVFASDAVIGGIICIMGVFLMTL